MLHRKQLAALLATALFAQQSFAQGFGGSNYFFYRANPQVAQAFGVINAYWSGHPAKDEIDAQLSAMRVRQNRIKIPIFFASDSTASCRGGEDGTIPVVPGGPYGYMLATYCSENLSSLLGTLQFYRGFHQVYVAFYPTGPNDPNNWPDNFCSLTSPCLYQRYLENWGVLRQVQATLTSLGIPYLLDLGNELLPGDYDGVGGYRLNPHLIYAKLLWRDYVNQFGTAGLQKTAGLSGVGFPDLVSSKRWLKYVGEVYGPNLPAYLDFHIYTEAKRARCNVDRALSYWNGLNSPLRTLPIIVGEAYYNDEMAAMGLNELKYPGSYCMADDFQPVSIGSSIYAIFQWPSRRAEGSLDLDTFHYNAGAPILFNRWASFGF